MLWNHTEDIALTLLKEKRKFKLDTVKATSRLSHFLPLFSSPLFCFFISLNQYQWCPL